MKQNRNIFSLPSAAASHIAAADSPGELVPSNVGDHLPRRADQRDAILRNPDVVGEPLAEGEVVFAPESETGPQTADEIDVEADFNPSAVVNIFRQFSLFAVALLTIVVTTSLLFAFSQTASLASEIGALPEPMSWVGFGALATLWLAIGVATCQLAATLLRLKRTPSVSLKGLGVLRQRADNRKQAANDLKTAELHIREFLRNYPRDEKQIRLLRSVGLSQKTVSTEDLLNSIDKQLQIDDGVPDQWLETVRARIVLPLDEAATKLIQRTALQVGAATAISPRGSVDALIVLAHSYQMVNDMCRLYGVRPGWLETGFILGQSAVAAALAAGGDQAADMLEERIRQALQDLLGIAAGAIAAKIGTRVAEGTANAMFVRRIGMNLQAYVCPLSGK